MEEALWIIRMAVDAMHHEMLAQHGGMPGVRDESALESALARPRGKWAYDPHADLASLGAAYAYGLAKNHAYNDGNKRIAFITMYTSLGMNGVELTAPEPEVVRVIFDLASGALGELELAEWVRTHITAADAPQ